MQNFITLGQPLLGEKYVVEEEKFTFGFDNNVTNICNNKTIVLVVMELALLLVMVAVLMMLFSLDCYKLVVLDHCHWTINLSRQYLIRTISI